MEHIFKKTTGIGNPMFNVATPEGSCKIIFDSKGSIVKAFCRNCVVYSRDDQNESCLKDVMYEMLIISQECFIEMFAEIHDETQLAYAKEIATRRNSELTALSIESAAKAAQLNSIL